MIKTTRLFAKTVDWVRIIERSTLRRYRVLDVVWKVMVDIADRRAHGVHPSMVCAPLALAVMSVGADVTPSAK